MNYLPMLWDNHQTTRTQQARLSKFFRAASLSDQKEGSVKLL
jgi:hypothetical protein